MPFSQIRKFISPQYELLRRGYVPETCATQRPKPKPDEVVLLSLDCETVQSEKNFHALARVTLVGHQVVLLDLLVRPPDPIVDYRTKWSGITEELLDGVDVTVEQAREKVLEVSVLCSTLHRCYDHSLVFCLFSVEEESVIFFEACFPASLQLRLGGVPCRS